MEGEMENATYRKRLREYPNLEYCKDIYRHPAVKEEHVVRLKKYCDEALEKGYVDVDYSTNYDGGRYYTTNTKQLSCCPMSKSVRATLFGETEYDVDIENCHFSILLWLLEKHFPDGGFYDKLYEYVNNRNRIIEEFNYEDKSKIKTLFPVIMYGGNVKAWEIEEDIVEGSYTLPPFVNEFKEQIQLITSILLNTPTFKPIKHKYYKYKLAEAKKKHDAAQQGKKKKTPFDYEKFNLHDGKYLSAILHEYERIIIDDVIENVLRECGIPITAYCYDGFQIRKSDCDEITIDDLIKKINDYVCISYYGRIRFANKPFKEPLDLKGMEEDTDFNINTFHAIDDYYIKKEYAEKFMFRCMNPPCMVIVGKNKNPLLLNQSQFNLLFSNLRVGSTPSQPVYKKDKYSFVKAWLDDPTALTYQEIGCYAPPQQTPFGHYNTWTGFPIEEVALDETADTSRIYKHISLVANGQTDAYEYLLNWFADIVKNPGKKSNVALLIQGIEGSGKSIVGEHLLKLIVGQDKLFITSNIDQLVGRFADNTHSLLTTMNECNGRDTFSSADALKDYITCDYRAIERKGIQTRPARMIDRVILTTNHLNALYFGNNCRRIAAFLIDPAYRNNPDYFVPLYADLNNKRVMRKFYQELLDRDLSEWNPIGDRPTTELTETINELNIDPLDLFDDAMRNRHGNNFEIRAGLLYEAYRIWREENGYNLQTTPTSTKFGVLMKMRDGITTRRTNKGVIYTFGDKE